MHHTLPVYIYRSTALAPAADHSESSSGAAQKIEMKDESGESEKEKWWLDYGLLNQQLVLALALALAARSCHSCAPRVGSKSQIVWALGPRAASTALPLRHCALALALPTHGHGFVVIRIARRAPGRLAAFIPHSAINSCAASWA